MASTTAATPDRKLAICQPLRALVLMAASILLARRRLFSGSCPKCHAIMSFREAPKAAELGYCPDCYRLFMRGANLDNELRGELEARVDHATLVRRWKILAGNTLLAGSGYLLRGTAWLGAPLLFATVAGLVLLLCSAPTNGPPFGTNFSTYDGRSALAQLILLLTYGISWTTTWVQRRRFD